MTDDNVPVECTHDGCDMTFKGLRGRSIHITTVHESEGRPWQDKETLKRLYYDEELRQSEIADLLGCGTRTVCRWMNRHDLEVYRTERTGESNRVERATFTHAPQGYERAIANYRGTPEAVQIHRLLAVAKYGFEALEGMEVHHRNHIPWDNREDNIELMTTSEHRRYHADVKWGNRPRPRGDGGKTRVWHLVCRHCAFEHLLDAELEVRERAAAHRERHPDHRVIYMAVDSEPDRLVDVYTGP